MLIARDEAVANVSGRILRRRSGKLADSIRSKVQIIEAGVRGSLSTDVFYGRIWELKGRKAFTIKPKVFRRRRAGIKVIIRRSKALQIAPGVFRTRARIPAAPKRPFLHPAIEVNKDRIAQIVAESMASELDRCLDGVRLGR